MHCDYHKIDLQAVREVGFENLCPKYVEDAMLALILKLDTWCDHAFITAIGRVTYDCPYEKVLMMLEPGPVYDWVEDMANWRRVRASIIAAPRR